MNNEATAAMFRALAGAMIDGELTISRRHLRAMAGLAGTELNDAERDLEGQGIIWPTATRGNRWAVEYRLTPKGWELLAGLPPVHHSDTVEPFTAYDYASAGKLWSRAPKGVPLNALDLQKLAPGANPNTVYRQVRKLAALPVPVATITRTQDNSQWVHCFHELDADDQRAVADHINERQDRRNDR